MIRWRVWSLAVPHNTDTLLGTVNVKSYPATFVADTD